MNESERERLREADAQVGRIGLRPQPAPAPPAKPKFPARALRTDWTPSVGT